MIRSRILALLGVVAVVALTGCSGSEMITLTAGETDIVVCPPDKVVVESLATVSRPTCSPMGSELVFPDGAVLEATVGTVSGSRSESRSGRTYAYIDVGIYGVVASTYSGVCDDLQAWGMPEAIEIVIDAFGDDLGNC
jgi:hypothetical protein